MKPILPFLLLISLNAVAQTAPELKTAAGHPMKYYLSLPKGWTKDRTWPILVVLESADKQFRENAQRFVDARKDLPYIIIAPVNVNNGNDGRKDPKLWPYTTADWKYIDSVGDCQFNHDGLLLITAQVAAQYHGEDKFYLEGFEAGTHALWPMVFDHPEKLKAALAVSGNYNRNSCISTQKYSGAKERIELPIIGVFGEGDQFYSGQGFAYTQWQAAKTMAENHGYMNITVKVIPGKAHVPLPDEVFEIIETLRK